MQGDTVSITLIWTAPGDDGMVGTCDHYQLRWSTDSTALVNYFYEQSGGLLAMTPQPPGSTEEYTVTGLNSETSYVFAVRAYDEVSNSSISNILRVTTPDNDEPAAITDLRIQ